MRESDALKSKLHAPFGISNGTSMIALIPIERLVPGMFVHDLNCGWIEHDFLRSSFLVTDAATVDRIRSIGVREVYIDTGRGAGLAAEAADARPGAGDGQAGGSSGPAPPVFNDRSVSAELRRVRALQREVRRAIRELMGDIRLGRPIRLEPVEPLVEDLVASIFRQPDALLPLVRLKEHDDYTFLHSVAVCVLMANFGRTLAMTADVVREVALGGLLHDVGKAKVPDEVLNKPAGLTDAEFDTMRSHVMQSRLLLQETPGVSDIALAVAAQHHERYDGSGYPDRLKGDEISEYGQMAAIVDVYDALTSDRVYRRALPPTAALRKLLAHSEFQFNPRLVHAFIRSVGIYPAGSLVRLDSDVLAVVQQQHADSLLMPKVLVIFDVAASRYVAPRLVDLSETSDRIVDCEDFGRWQIDPARWIAAV